MEENGPEIHERHHKLSPESQKQTPIESFPKSQFHRNHTQSEDLGKQKFSTTDNKALGVIKKPSQNRNKNSANWVT
jgi:hypothetical protein